MSTTKVYLIPGKADEGAEYDEVIDLDLSAVEPHAVFSGLKAQPDNALATEELRVVLKEGGETRRIEPDAATPARRRRRAAAPLVRVRPLPRG